ncbi:oligoendopeptidase F [Candidatus Neptunochlamydia vexilliferae]|uniref:Oligopeptidase F n=1 Tax=Candidatus Neptunichlamydia vexilliferae TaxID=1651774 RepID=A0ABS0B0Q8_9BACT|nr:oligoendopeptidase F [Candidatus Neptunochlamydia vexilliferae]MBF5059784.1 Oligoendopeptidase F [Candidatus Neptunochlamydia vexilliferae]
MAKERTEVQNEDTWDVASLYSNLDAWEKEFKELTKNKSEKGSWPQIAEYQGKIREDGAKLASLLQETFNVERKLYELYTYAHLRHDEDVAHELHKDAYDRISLLYYDFQSETAWIQPAILQLPKETLESYLKEDALKEYKVYLEKISALKPYTLSADKEQLLSLAGKALETPQKAFGVFNNADLQFGTIQNEKGEERELTHGTYSLYLQSKDRTLRKNAALHLHQKYGQFENTVSELINGQVQRHIFQAKARNYPSALHAALTPHQISTDVYHNLVETVRKNLSTLHRYVSLRKKLLGYDKLHFYDLYVSLMPQFEKSYTYEEAVQLTLDAVHPLGEEYHRILEKGLGKERWVDRYENARKRSGAYSSGCYDSVPYILLNFHGTLRDVMTLAHEAGHSVHSYCSNKGQPYHYANYPIFVAEVASTFNEELLFRHLMEKATSPQERCYLLNQKIDDVRSTLFRQTQFAEFELTLHSLAEKGIPLTATTLKNSYRKLNQEYYGPDLYIDPEIDVEYLRIPHFYYNFYVYQYATGISAAYALVEKLMKEGESAQKDYLKFLSSGSSRYPVELLEIAGVNMKESGPVQVLIDRFATLVDEFEKEFSSC